MAPWKRMHATLQHIYCTTEATAPQTIRNKVQRAGPWLVLAARGGDVSSVLVRDSPPPHRPSLNPPVQCPPPHFYLGGGSRIKARRRPPRGLQRGD